MQSKFSLQHACSYQVFEYIAIEDMNKNLADFAIDVSLWQGNQLPVAIAANLLIHIHVHVCIFILVSLVLYISQFNLLDNYPEVSTSQQPAGKHNHQSLVLFRVWDIINAVD